ncbi:MAG TPA: hypothetical protein VL068_11205, partial [Microthrixaceae bacterium]|nr:hypothetical protein [Microthrixaceae bacterium]
LGAMSIFGGNDGPNSAGKPSADAKESPTSTSTTIAPVVSTSTTSLDIPLDWYPKQSSRYSNRQPPVSVTTLPADPSKNDEGGTGAKNSSGGTGSTTNSRKAN